MAFRPPEAASVVDNPSPEELKELAAQMPNARPTRYGNLNVQTEVVSRSKRSTFIVTDEPDGQNQSITREEGERWAERQDAYIADQEMVVVDGYIGNGPEFRTPARLYIEAANANIAGMQQQLYFSAEGEQLEPELTVIYTPNLEAEGYADDRLHAPERLAPRAGRLRRLDAERPRLRDRERVLREDVRLESGGRADHLRGGHAAGVVPRERLAAWRRGRLLRHELHLERAR